MERAQHFLCCVCGGVLCFFLLLYGGTAEARRYAITITDHATFRLPAILVTRRTLNPRPEFNNGVNPVDVAIITDAAPTLGTRGALWFGTNTSLCVLVGCTIGASNIDIAFVRARRNRNRIFIRVDGNIFGLPAARLNVFNIYNVTSGLFAQVHNVLAGEIEIRFRNRKRAVRGQIRLLGSSGFTGPYPTSQYVADFSGRRIRKGRATGVGGAGAERRQAPAIVDQRP